ncbi:MAG: hypothetical protein PVF75_04440 [Granulosicoccaceae bacterium]|jgi:hypothetical protein
MELLLAAMHYFTEHPLAAFVLSMVFMMPCFLPHFNSRQKLVLCTSTLVWLFYGFWEVYMSQVQAAATEPVTRGDLGLIGPFVLFFAVIGVITILRGFVRPSTECEVSFNEK